VPDTIGGDLVETKPELGGSARQSDYELRIKEWLSASETEDADPSLKGLFKEADSCGDIESVGPFDGNTAMRTGEVALIRPGEGEIVGPKSAGAAPYGSPFAATGAQFAGCGMIHYGPEKAVNSCR
jgi:hypothetical protein